LVAAERAPITEVRRTGRDVYAARRSYLWWRPPTSGIATIGPAKVRDTGR
jgi:hypothetical protein